MQQDEISQTIISYVQQHTSPSRALLPSELTQGILDILIEDTKHMAAQSLERKPQAGQYITLAVLLYKAQQNETDRIDISERELKKEISAYTQAIYLENLERQGVIKNISPVFSSLNLLKAKPGLSYDLTELGKRLAKDSLDQLPHYGQD